MRGKKHAVPAMILSIGILSAVAAYYFFKAYPLRGYGVRKRIPEDPERIRKRPKYDIRRMPNFEKLAQYKPGSRNWLEALRGEGSEPEAAEKKKPSRMLERRRREYERMETALKSAGPAANSLASLGPTQHDGDIPSGERLLQAEEDQPAVEKHEE